jgi:hypothetical protein
VCRMIGEMQGKGLVTEIIDCDALGHLSYLPGTPSYDAIVGAFGEEVVKEGEGGGRCWQGDCSDEGSSQW